MTISGAARPVRAVTILAVPELQILDLAGPFEVFQGANAALAARGESAGYQLDVVGAEPGRLRTSGGISLFVDPLPDPGLPIDTLLLPGGDGARRGGGAAWVAAGILLSRIFGLVRTRLLGHFLGTGPAMDALTAAIKIPNLFAPVRLLRSRPPANRPKIIVASAGMKFSVS